jgi:hypothetical protein
MEFGTHDISRIWNLAIAIYDGDEEDADLRDFFLQAMDIYIEFMEDAAQGGLEFDDGDVHYVSERTVGPDGDKLRFVVAKEES